MYRRVYVFVGKCKSSVVRQLLAVRVPAKQLNHENFQKKDFMATLVFCFDRRRKKEAGDLVELVEGHRRRPHQLPDTPQQLIQGFE